MAIEPLTFQDLAERWHRQGAPRPYVPVFVPADKTYAVLIDADFVSAYDVEAGGQRLARDAIKINDYMESRAIEEDWPEDLLEQLLPYLEVKDAWEENWPVLVTRPWLHQPQQSAGALFVQLL